MKALRDFSSRRFAGSREKRSGERPERGAGSARSGASLLSSGGWLRVEAQAHELHRRKLRYGMATLCVGGGMGIATIVERI